MEDKEFFDPVKQLSPRVLRQLEGAPALKFDFTIAPQPGEACTIYFIPDNFEKYRANGFEVKRETGTVLKWHHNEDGEIIALVYRDKRDFPQVIYGDDWTIYEDQAILGGVDVVQQDIQCLHKKIVVKLRQKAEEALTARVEREMEIAAQAREILFVHQPSPDTDELKTIDHARRRALELMEDEHVRITVVAETEIGDDLVASAFGCCLLESLPRISSRQGEVAQAFLDNSKTVWAWRESQGYRVRSIENEDDHLTVTVF